MKLIDLNDKTTINAEHIAAITKVTSWQNSKHQYYYNIVMLNKLTYTQTFDTEEKAQEHRSWLINILGAVR